MPLWLRNLGRRRDRTGSETGRWETGWRPSHLRAWVRTFLARLSVPEKTEHADVNFKRAVKTKAASWRNLRQGERSFWRRSGRAADARIFSSFERVTGAHPFDRQTKDLRLLESTTSSQSRTQGWHYARSRSRAPVATKRVEFEQSSGFMIGYRRKPVE